MNSQEARDMLCDWLTANDVDPELVPADTVLDVTGTTITLDVWPTRESRDAERRSVPLKTPFPGDLDEALTAIREWKVE